MKFSQAFPAVVAVLAVLCVLFLFASCGDDTHDASPDAGADADTDADTDTDTDTDSDTDTDTDTDSDSDTDTDADTDLDAGTDSGDPEYPDGGAELPAMSLYESACGGADEAPTCLYFVDADAVADGGISGDGLSWATAFGTVQEGINAAFAALGGNLDAGAGDASTGEARCHVWVAEGTYYPTEGASGDVLPADPATVTISLREGVYLYGGFDGTETACDQRDIAAHETNLSGDIGVADDKSDNAYHVVTGADEAVLDGFTVRRGGIVVGTGLPWEAVLRMDGSAMLNDGTSPTIAHCLFVDNYVDIDGEGNTCAALSNRAGSSPLVYDCEFRGNVGAVKNAGAETRPLFYGCTFEGNSTGICGGDECPGGGAIVDSYSPSIVVNSRFISNTANHGGAISCSDASMTIINSVFIDNSAWGWDAGGAIAIIRASPDVINCTFEGNTDGNIGSGSGAAISVYGASHPTIIDSVLTGDAPQIGVGYTDFHKSAPTCSAYASDIWTGDEVGCAGTGNLDADPLFVNADTDLGEIDLRLQAGSPCVDTGATSLLPNDFLDLDSDGDTDEPLPLDLDGNPRVVGAAVDMGAYEFQP